MSRISHQGLSTDNPELTDTAYVAILSDNTEFGQLTPGNSMKWVGLSPIPKGSQLIACGMAIGCY